MKTIGQYIVLLAIAQFLIHLCVIVPICEHYPYHKYPVVPLLIFGYFFVIFAQLCLGMAIDKYSPEHEHDPTGI